MGNFKCPDCGKQSVEKRACLRPGNVKLRKVGGIHDEYVCRNSECKWTGEDEYIGEDTVRAPEKHEKATDW